MRPVQVIRDLLFSMTIIPIVVQSASERDSDKYITLISCLVGHRGIA